MEEDDEMEVEQQVFDVYEIDLNYEFEAAMFFDFSREESEAEAWLAEQWFESAQRYPHSPFAQQMILREKILTEELSTSLRSKDVVNVDGLHDRDLDVCMGVSCAVGVNNNGMVKGIFTGMPNMQNIPLRLTTGLTSQNKNPMSRLIAEKKPSVKPSFPRSSTLMKPTLSQLAKQNKPRQGGGSRFISNREKSLCSSSGLESQAPKRQKLEGGQLHKVAGNSPLTHLVHKAPKQDGIFEKIHLHPKMKLTIPKEPVLQTARRAHRIKAKSGKELEHATSTVCPFKARPLNRKILEAPSFPLSKIPQKLPDLQVVNYCHKSMAEGNNFGTRRSAAVVAGKQSGCDTIYTFKAHPGKAFAASKGYQVAFRNSKHEKTAPKRYRHQPPIDLFSKLSLKSEIHPNNASHLEVHRQITDIEKDLKENRAIFSKPIEEVSHSVKEKPPIFSGTWTQVCN